MNGKVHIVYTSSGLVRNPDGSNWQRPDNGWNHFSTGREAADKVRELKAAGDKTAKRETVGYGDIEKRLNELGLVA